MRNCIIPFVIPSNAEEPRRKPHFAPLDCHVATFVAPRNDKRKIWNIPLACRARQHQADNLAKLWQEILSLLELIAKIFCAVVIVRTSEALGNTQPRVAVASAAFEQLGIDIYFNFV